MVSISMSQGIRPRIACARFELPAMPARLIKGEVPSQHGGRVGDSEKSAMPVARLAIGGVCQQSSTNVAPRLRAWSFVPRLREFQ